LKGQSVVEKCLPIREQNVARVGRELDDELPQGATLGGQEVRSVGRPEPVEVEGPAGACEGGCELLRGVLGVRRAYERETLLKRGELGGEIVE
jgi:hypothetical protein